MVRRPSQTTKEFLHVRANTSSSFSVPGGIEPESLDNIHQHDIKTCLDDSPTMEKLKRAIASLKSLKYGKVPGGDRIAVEE